jgi:hypothetical protein
MRCFFMRKGHIVDVEILAGLSDEDAVKKSCELFAARASEFDGFEVWELTRMVIQHPPPEAVEQPKERDADAQIVPISSRRSA